MAEVGGGNHRRCVAAFWALSGLVLCCKVLCSSGPMAISVCLSNSTGLMFENSPTLSCGRNCSGLSTWMFSFSISCFTLAFVQGAPSIFQTSLFRMSKSTRTVMLRPGPCPSTISVSTYPVSIGLPFSSLMLPSPCTHAAILSPRPVIFSGPPRPTHMAHTMLDFPVPFGPTMQLSLVPGSTISASRYDMKLLREKRTAQGNSTHEFWHGGRREWSPAAAATGTHWSLTRAIVPRAEMVSTEEAAPELFFCLLVATPSLPGIVRIVSGCGASAGGEMARRSPRGEEDDPVGILHGEDFPALPERKSTHTTVTKCTALGPASLHAREACALRTCAPRAPMKRCLLLNQVSHILCPVHPAFYVTAHAHSHPQSASSRCVVS